MILKRKKSKKKLIKLRNRILLVLLFIVIDIFLVFSFIRIKNAINVNKLNKRFYELLEVNFTSNNYNTKIDTTGKYKIVEEAMDNYFIDYSSKVREVLDIINSDKLNSLLTINNYSNDAPQFVDSIDYINNTREDLNVRFAELYNYSNESYIDNYIRNISKDPEVRKIFKKYIYSIEANDHFDDCNSLLKKKQNEVNNILDVSRDVMYFLVANNGKWIIKDEQIQFANNDLKVQYDGFISRIK